MHTELDKVVAALKEFYAREALLFEQDLGERTLNLPRGSIVSTDDHLGKSIYPDIVVHQRAVPKNHIAIEVRKASNHQPVEHDRHKLRALTDQHIWFAYWIGVLVLLGKSGVTSSEVFVSGMPHEELSQYLARRLKEAGIGVA